jgi:ribosomal silencing factor RsfS
VAPSALRGGIQRQITATAADGEETEEETEEEEAATEKRGSEGWTLRDAGC